MYTTHQPKFILEKAERMKWVKSVMNTDTKKYSLCMAYHYIDAIGDKMQYASFRKLLNVRRSYMVAALPFIKDDSIRIAVENLSEK